MQDRQRDRAAADLLHAINAARQNLKQEMSTTAGSEACGVCSKSTKPPQRHRPSEKDKQIATLEAKLAAAKNLLQS